MRPTAKTKGYLPTLDGWRALAVIGVLCAHAPDQGHRLMIVTRLKEVGPLGVNLFFAISGILICTRLLQEEQDKGSISLSNFYIRRFYRIMPLAIVYLMVVAVLGSLSFIPSDSNSWWGALLFYRNYIHYFQGSTENNWFTAQFWSLSVEEHFYFLLPSLLVFLPRFRKSALLGLTTICFVWMLVNVYVVKDQNGYWVQRTEFCLPYLLIPALYAVLMREPRVMGLIRRYLHPPVGIFFALVVLFLSTRGMPPGYELAPIFAIATLFPLLLISTMHHPGHFFSRFLELAPLRFIGRLSYSLYIWQQLFFRRNYEFPRYGIHYLQLPWVNLLCLVPCALLSYYFIEQPLIRAGQKIVRSRVPVAVLAV